MAPGRARDDRKEQQRRRRTGEWRAGGPSGRAFCERCGLALPGLYARRRALQRRAAAKAERATPPLSRRAGDNPGSNRLERVVLR